MPLPTSTRQGVQGLCGFVAARTSRSVFFGKTRHTVEARYRLKTESKGSCRFCWTLEYWDGSGLVEDPTITDLFYPFWKPTTTNYRHNDSHCEAMADVSWLKAGAESRAVVVRLDTSAPSHNFQPAPLGPP